jgi:hypothetical protein
MNYEWERIRKEAAVFVPRSNSGIFLERIRSRESSVKIVDPRAEIWT